MLPLETLRKAYGERATQTIEPTYQAYVADLPGEHDPAAGCAAEFSLHGLIPIEFLEAAAFANADIAQSLFTTNRDLVMINEQAEIACEVTPFAPEALRDAFTLRPGAIPAEESKKKSKKEGKRRKHGEKKHRSKSKSKKRQLEATGGDNADAPPKKKRRR